jgi:hypothetical protein
MSLIERVPTLSSHSVIEPENIWIVITFRNAEKYIDSCLSSIFSQTAFNKIKVLITDDNSTDKSDVIINKYKSMYENKILHVKNSERMYKLKNIIKLLDTNLIGDSDIIVFLDGDDSLATTSSIQTILDTYSTYGCWVTYGSYTHLDKTPGCCAREMTYSEKQCENFRKMPWMFSHLFTFRYFIWKSIPTSYFYSESEIWYKFASDVIINLAICDIAKPSRIKFIDMVLCVYNNISEYSDWVIDIQSQTIVSNMAREKRMPQYKLKCAFDYTIIIPYMNRLENLKITLTSIVDSIKLSGKKIGIIVVEHSACPDSYHLCKEFGVEYFHLPICPDVLLLSKFNKSLCFDTAVLWGIPSTAYVCHDVDIFIPENFWLKLDEEAITFDVFQPYSKRTVHRLLPDITDKIHKGICSYKDVNASNCFEPYPGSWGGSLYIKRDIYFKIGGHDCDLFIGYAPEDQLIIYKIGEHNVGFSSSIELFHQYHKPASDTNPYLCKMHEVFEYMKNNHTVLHEYIKNKTHKMESV